MRATAGCAVPAAGTAAHRAWDAGGWGTWGYAAAGLLAGLQALPAVQASCEVRHRDQAGIRPCLLHGAGWQKVDLQTLP